MTGLADLLARDFATLPEVLRAHAVEHGDRRAIVQGDEVLTYSELDRLVGRIAFALQRDGVAARASVAMVSETTVTAVAIFLGILRAGCVPAPIAPSSTTAQVESMIADCGAPLVFADADARAVLPSGLFTIIANERLRDWIAPETAVPQPVVVGPPDAFNIIYSSGTTGTPKGIVHTHEMRWTQIKAYAEVGFENAVTMVATPLYSNTTLVNLLPTLAYGGTAVLLGKFDARRFLQVAERERATHAMLVPVQYQRLMSIEDFESFDLSSFVFKSCTSAPFAAELKADIVRRWPGVLLEIYGMTEGGGTCVLLANEHPDKLHTVGQPAPGNDIRIIDENGFELAPGEVGEVVGRSAVMMAGYHGRPEASTAAEWRDAEGNRFIRHGDLGRFDEDGFLTLLGRSKDMIISGGFNIYPPDIEAVIMEHPNVVDAAVVGIPSAAWGETPHAFYVVREEGVSAQELLGWVNARVGKTQRLSSAEELGELPRSAIGKVLKRELRDRFLCTAAT